MSTRNVLEAYGSDIIGSHVEVGAGGHEILNPSGISMTQEEKMQFTGNVTVTDDSTNGKTVVNIEDSGHTIKNSSGTAMTQQPNMQFADSFVTNDSVGEATVVENVKEVTLAELSQATERGMYLATDEESVPIGASSEDKIEVTGDGAKTLGQLLNAIYNDTKFDITKITKDTKLVFGTNVYFPTIISPDYNYVRFTRETCNASYLYIEDYTISSSSVAYATTVNGNTYSRVDDSSTVEPNGLKLTLYYGTSSTVINLKTSADYCMMPDGVTSVESAIGDTVKIGKIFDTEKCKGILAIAGNTAILACTVTSGTGISQYTSLLYQQIPSAYRPSSNIRATANMSSDLGAYNFQILNTGSLQNLAAIPANITTTIMATWNFS